MNKIVSLAAAAGIILVLTFAVNLTPADNQATAEVTPFPSREKVISVTGTATSSVEPDLLVIQFGVEIQEDTAREALESNSSLMTSVVDSIKAVGITEDEISTSRFNIHPVYGRYNEQTGQSPLIGYRVTNTISVETSNLSSAADIIDNGVAAGANRVDSVYFTLSPEKQIQVKDGLIADAVLNAKSKAENALAPLNHKIIGVKSLFLSEFGMPPPMPLYYGDFAMAESASFKASTPVFSSDQDVTTTASVIFLIGSN